MDADIARWTSIETNQCVKKFHLFNREQSPSEIKWKKLIDSKNTDRKANQKKSLSYLAETPILIQKGNLASKRLQKIDIKIDNQENCKKEVAPGEMIDILQKFDSIKIKNSCVRKYDTSNAEIQVQRKNTIPTLKFLTAPQFSLTKFDHYKAVNFVDKKLIIDGKYIKHADIGKIQKVKEYKSFIKKELAEISKYTTPTETERKKLYIYSICFDHLIQDFPAYQEILADIKREYDTTIVGFESNEAEMNYLKGKVNSLLSENQNRLLLKFEKQKCKELKNNIALIESENERLKNKITNMISVYVPYLPTTIIQKEKDLSFEYGQDPLSKRDAELSYKENAMKEKIDEIKTLETGLEREFVPRLIKEDIEERLKNLEIKHCISLKNNLSLEEWLVSSEKQILELEKELYEKDQHYQFLVTEYKDLSEQRKNTENS